MDGNPCGGHIVVNSEFRLGWLSKCYQWINFLGLKNHWKSTILALGCIPTTWGSITVAWTMVGDMVGEGVAATLGLISENVAFDGSLLKWKSLKYWKQHTWQQPSGCPFPFFIPFIHFDMLIAGMCFLSMFPSPLLWRKSRLRFVLSQVKRPRGKRGGVKNKSGGWGRKKCRCVANWKPLNLVVTSNWVVFPKKKREVKKKGCGG